LWEVVASQTHQPDRPAWNFGGAPTVQIVSLATYEQEAA